MLKAASIVPFTPFAGIWYTKREEERQLGDPIK
jgi:hypothetical protein